MKIAVFSVGLGLFYGVLKFFEAIEKRLNDDTKLEIAVWLLGVRVGTRTESWPQTFAKVFDRVFGKRHLSISCLFRSVCASLLGIAVIVTVNWLFQPSFVFLPVFVRWPWSDELRFVALCLFPNLLVDYVALLKTRWMLRVLARFHPLSRGVLMGVDFVATYALAVIAHVWGFTLYTSMSGHSGYVDAFTGAIRLLPAMLGDRQMVELLLTNSGFTPIFFYPVFLTSVWVWMYVASGFVLKAANRFDDAFSWFSKHFDIENKPLQSLGLVAGAMSTIAYWLFVALNGVQ